MNYRSDFLATTILIGEKSFTSYLIARHVDEKSCDCEQIIIGFHMTSQQHVWSIKTRHSYWSESMDHFHYRLNFDLNKSRQKFHHSLKEHHKISNIPKFRCEML